MATEREDESAEALIYDWNARGRPNRLGDRKVMVYDETLRDGLQGPSVYDPPLDAKKKIIELLDALGVSWVNLGLPGAGPRAVKDVTELAKHIRDKGLSIKPSCAARTHINDIRPVAEIMQKVGIEIEVMAFLGASAFGARNRGLCLGEKHLQLGKFITAKLPTAGNEGLYSIVGRWVMACCKHQPRYGRMAGQEKL